MKLKNMLAGMTFCGEVRASRRSYTVFRNKSGYVLSSQKSGSIWQGDFVIVKEKAVEYLANRLKGQKGLTSSLIRNRTRTSPFARDHFDVLHGIYVLVALGRAKKDMRFKKRAIHFNVMG